jgi:hypothetical protein
MIKTLIAAASLLVVSFTSVQSQERVGLTRFCTNMSDLYQIIRAERFGKKMEYLILTTSGGCRDTNAPKAPSYAAHFVGFVYLYSGSQIFEIGVHTDKYSPDIVMMTWTPVQLRDKTGVSRTYRDAVEQVNNLLGRWQ